MTNSTRSRTRSRSRSGSKGRFHRPELTTPWQKFSRNIVVRISVGVLLVAATAALLYIAIAEPF